MQPLLVATNKGLNMKNLILNYNEVDEVFGIKGLSDDSFFSAGVVLQYDGFLFELDEICGDQIFFKRTWDTEGNQKIADQNYFYFNDRSMEREKENRNESYEKVLIDGRFFDKTEMEKLPLAEQIKMVRFAADHSSEANNSSENLMDGLLPVIKTVLDQCLGDWKTATDGDSFFMADLIANLCSDYLQDKSDYEKWDLENAIASHTKIEIIGHGKHRPNKNEK